MDNISFKSQRVKSYKIKTTKLVYQNKTEKAIMNFYYVQGMIYKRKNEYEKL